MRTRSIYLQLTLSLPSALGQLVDVLGGLQTNLNNVLEPAKNAANDILSNASPNQILSNLAPPTSILNIAPPSPILSIAPPSQILSNAAPNIASLVDQVGQNAASMASNAVNMATSDQENQVNAQLSSYHNYAPALNWPILAAAACIVAYI